MSGRIEVAHNQSFDVSGKGLKRLRFRFAMPVSFNSPTVQQKISGYGLRVTPEVTWIGEEVDEFGNVFKVLTWDVLHGDVSVEGSFTVDLAINLKELKSTAPFPLETVPPGERRFLKATELTQSEAARIKELAGRLTKGAESEQEAVTRILNWVVDNVRYKTPVQRYDALWTLDTKSGNCQNFSHISIALLRAVKIPARIVGGISLEKPWKVPLKEGYLVQSIGQGGHAWMEVYYPDLGWVSYDAQQSHLFVSPRHIKQTVGLDSMDINDSWRASPVLPRYHEKITAEFIEDSVRLSLKETRGSPRNYVLANSVITTPAAREKPKVKEEPPLPKGEMVEFGNMDFPDLMNLYTTGEGVGYRTLDKETAEYVTSGHKYAQAFKITEGLKLYEVSLAMHKFGGRIGSLWVDVVKDEGGMPGMKGVRSFPLSLDTIGFSPGYRWFSFKFSMEEADAPVIKPGRYWIVLRHSKDAIVNWFYIPSNPYGDPDDTRSTSKGINWSNVLNYDFNFKVAGRYQ